MNAYYVLTGARRSARGHGASCVEGRARSLLVALTPPSDRFWGGACSMGPAGRPAPAPPSLLERPTHRACGLPVWASSLAGVTTPILLLAGREGADSCT